MKRLLLYVVSLLIGCSNPIQTSSDEELKKPLEEALETGHNHFEKEEFEKAIDIFFKGLEYAQEINDADYQGKFYLKIGYGYEKLNKNANALEVYEKLLALEDLTNPKLKIEAHLEIASMFTRIGRDNESLPHLLEALNLANSIQANEELFRIQYELGFYYSGRDDYISALNYFKGALKAAKSSEDKRDMIFSYSALASEFDNANIPDSALYYNKLAFEQATLNKDSTLQGYILHNFGDIRKKAGNFAGALADYNASLNLREEIEDYWGMIADYMGLGKIYLETNQFDLAEEKLLKGLELAREQDLGSRYAEIYSLLSKLYGKTGKFEEAYQFSNKLVDINKELATEESQTQVAKLTTSIEMQKKNFELELAENKSAIQEIWNSALSIVVLLLLGLVGMIFYYYREQRRTTAVLKEQKTILQEQKEEIEQKNEQLALINAELKQFTYGVSHDLKAPLRTISGFSTMLKRRYVKDLDENAMEYMEYISGGVKQMQNLVEQLLDYARIGVDKSQQQDIPSSEILQSVILNLQGQIQEEHASVEVSEGALPIIHGNPTQIIQLFQNLVSNGIKFRRKDHLPKIEISCEPNGTSNIFSVKDNGIGISGEYRKKIFEMFSRLNKRDDYEGSGIGLATCKKIVEIHGGKIWVESEPGEGSTFFFTLPKVNPN